MPGVLVDDPYFHNLALLVPRTLIEHRERASPGCGPDELVEAYRGILRDFLKVNRGMNEFWVETGAAVLQRAGARFFALEAGPANVLIDEPKYRLVERMITSSVFCDFDEMNHDAPLDVRESIADALDCIIDSLKSNPKYGTEFEVETAIAVATRTAASLRREFGVDATD